MQNVVCPYNGILISHERKVFYTCYNMNEARRHYAKWNKLVTKGETLYDSTYEVPKAVKFIKTEEEMLPGTGEEILVTV